jgi:hypothetical protein
MAATSATVAVSGNVVVGITSSGMTVTGVVSGTSFTGNGANLANITGANVSGQVANAAYATSAGFATVANSANSVALANVVGAGNIASINLNGNAGQVLAGDGNWVTSGGGNVAYADVAGEAYSVDGANVSGQVANAASADVALSVAGANVSGQVSSAASADVALSVAGANVSGTVGAASVAYSVDAANVSGQVSSAASADVALSVDGANVSGNVAIADLSYSVDGANVTGTVANATFAATAGTAQSVSRSNVSGVTGIGGQVQFNTVAGNLTSSERYWFGANGAGGLNVSRDNNPGTIIAGYSYMNGTAPATMFFSRARGTKAAPLPVQVGDRIFSTLGQIYTGTGSATADGITGWSPATNSAAISIDVTGLPLSNTGTYSSRLRFTASNAVTNSTVSMDFNDDGSLNVQRLRVTQPVIPASASDTGTYGEITFDANYVYICVAPDTWKRSPLTTW